MQIVLRRLALACLAVALSAPLVLRSRAADAPPTTTKGAFKPMFDGKTLAG